MRDPHSVRADRNPTGDYIADSMSIRYFDEAKDQVTLFAGEGDTSFGQLHAMIVSSCGSVIWCSDERMSIAYRSNTRPAPTHKTEIQPNLRLLRVRTPNKRSVDFATHRTHPVSSTLN